MKAADAAGEEAQVSVSEPQSLVWFIAQFTLITRFRQIHETNANQCFQLTLITSVLKAVLS